MTSATTIALTIYCQQAAWLALARILTLISKICKISVIGALGREAERTATVKPQGASTCMNALGTAAVDDWTEVNEQLRGAAPLDVLEWAVDRFHPRLTMATAFGAEGCVLLHLLAEIEPRVRVFNLDTGYQFAETLELRDRIAERYGIEVELMRPDTTVAEYEQVHGGPLYVANPTSAVTIGRSCRCGGRWSVTTPGSRRFDRISRHTGPVPRSWRGTRNSAW